MTDAGTAEASRVAGARVLVTGANRGIGASYVEVLMERGAATVYAGVRDLGSLAAAQETYGDRLVPVELDVTDAAQVDAAAQACGPLDLLVCNAGQTCKVLVLAAPDEQVFRDVMEVNFFGPLHLVRAFAPSLVATGGGLIFTLSTASSALSRSAPIYSASKSAALMMTLGLREELRDQGVSVTNVFPGFIRTDMSKDAPMPMAGPRQVAERGLDGWESKVPTVWPDHYAELVSEAVDRQSLRLLDEPKDVMNELVASFLKDPKAGS